MRTRNHNMRRNFIAALLSCVAAIASPIGAATSDTAADKKPTDTSTPAKKPHLSPLATQGPKPAPITPPKPEEITSSIDRGIKFLLADQRADGSWGSPEHTKSLNIYAPPPGAHDAFQTAVT